MKRTKAFGLVTVAASLSLVLAGCASTTATTEEPAAAPSAAAPSAAAPSAAAPSAAAPAADAVSVAILTGVGLQDSGLGRATQEAADSLESQFGAAVDVQGSMTPEGWAEALRNYGSRGYDLVIANDIVGQAAALEVGPEFPDTKFVVINGYAGQEPNVSAVSFDWEYGGYLAGLLGGIASKSGKLAGIGADETIIPIVGLMDGFTAGVKKINPGAEVQVSYTGTGMGDPIKATQQAKAAIGNGADVIFGVANGGQPGLFQAATEGGALAIGFGVDEYDVAPKAVVSSIMLDYAGAITRVFERFSSSKLAPEVVIEGVKENVWSLADSRGLLTPEQVDKVAAEVAAATTK